MSADTVILVHGLWMTGVEMSLLKRRLRTAGFHVIQFRYRMVTRTLGHNTSRLAKFIRKHAVGHTHLLGHSLGGVLALQTLQEHPDLPVDKVLCLGSPLCDSSAGRRFIKYAPGRAMLGKTLPEAVFDQPLAVWQGPQKVGVIAGTRAFGLGRFIALLPRPNDGMVAVSETCLPGIDDHLSLQVTHTGLVVSSSAAQQCVHFLCHGAFRR
jgi:pimeloyl-ACP methyl ester carboxylesterase